MSITDINGAIPIPPAIHNISSDSLFNILHDVVINGPETNIKSLVFSFNLFSSLVVQFPLIETINQSQPALIKR